MVQFDFNAVTAESNIEGIMKNEKGHRFERTHIRLLRRVSLTVAEPRQIYQNVPGYDYKVSVLGFFQNCTYFMHVAESYCALFGLGTRRFRKLLPYGIHAKSHG